MLEYLYMYIQYTLRHILKLLASMLFFSPEYFGEEKKETGASQGNSRSTQTEKFIFTLVPPLCNIVIRSSHRRLTKKEKILPF